MSTCEFMEWSWRRWSISCLLKLTYKRSTNPSANDNNFWIGIESEIGRRVKTWHKKSVMLSLELSFHHTKIWYEFYHQNWKQLVKHHHNHPFQKRFPKKPSYQNLSHHHHLLEKNWYLIEKKKGWTKRRRSSCVRRLLEERHFAHKFSKQSQQRLQICSLSHLAILDICSCLLKMRCQIDALIAWCVEIHVHDDCWL